MSWSNFPTILLLKKGLCLFGVLGWFFSHRSKELKGQTRTAQAGKIYSAVGSGNV